MCKACRQRSIWARIKLLCSISNFFNFWSASKKPTGQCLKHHLVCLSNSVRLSHSHLSVICFVKERKRIIKHFKSLSIKTFLKTSKNQTDCDILTSSFNHRRSSEEPNYTPTLKNRQLPNNKKFHKNRQQTEIQQLLFQILFQNFQNTFNPKSKQPKTIQFSQLQQKLNSQPPTNTKGRLKSLSDDLCQSKHSPKQIIANLTL